MRLLIFLVNVMPDVKLMVGVDSEAVYDFFLRINNDFIPPLSDIVNIKNYATKLIEKSKIFASFDNGKLIALCGVYATDTVNNSAFVSMLAVDENYRGLGLGIKLMNVMECELTRKKIAKIQLEVFKNNTNAIFMYKKLGYVVERETDGSFFLCKNLENNNIKK